MEIFLLFLVAAFLMGIFRPELPLRVMAVIIVGMAIMVSAGYFVFRLV
jgi:hypothetical protein